MAVSSWRRYGVAFLCATLALLIASCLRPLGYGSGQVFLAAVMVSAWYGGLGPGLLVTFLATLTLELLPFPDPSSASALRVGLFVLVALLISSLNAANRRLQQALRAEQQRKDDFLAFLGHELRNPLGALLSTIHCLRQRESDPVAVARCSEIMARQARHMRRLVNDLLDITRIRQGKLELHLQRLDLATVVSGAVEATQFLIEPMGHTLDIVVPAGQFFVNADPIRLEQIVVNLLTNAAKFSRSGGHIRVTGEATSGEILLRVRDDGAGIPVDLLPRVFDLHVQEQNGSHGGLGLGLCLVRSLVEMHRGRVTAASAGPDLGSEFVIRLPALSPDSPARLLGRGPGESIRETRASQ